MITKEQLLESCLKECRICLHLFEKIPVGGFDYRPTPGQRSTLELLRYLSFCGAAGAHSMTDGNWDWYSQAAKNAESMSAGQFPTAMRRQMDELQLVFSRISSEAFANRETTLPRGDTTTLDVALMETALKWLTGYKMQLFLYIKGAGNETVRSANCWSGMDPEPKKA